MKGKAKSPRVMNTSGYPYSYFRKMKSKSRKKNRARPISLRTRLGISVSSDILAKGCKGGTQPALEPCGKTDHISEISDVIVEQSNKGRMISIMNRKRYAGTLECRHNLQDRWTSMRTHDKQDFPDIPEGKYICQKCEYSFWV